MTSIAKLKDRARKHEQKEDWKAAIEAYQMVLEAEEGQDELELELGLFNRVGDLYLRLGQTDEAVSYYEMAADKYAESGFYNNAIALCNKALRHRPDRAETYMKLSRLCIEQGFVPDARRWILEFAERKVKTGRVEEALTGLQDFADSTDDPDVRELLAQHLAKNDRADQAVAQLLRARNAYRAQRNDEAADRVAARARELDPGVDLDAGAAADDLDFASGTIARPGTAEEPEEEPGLALETHRHDRTAPDEEEDVDTLGGLETFAPREEEGDEVPAEDPGLEPGQGVGLEPDEEEAEPLPLLETGYGEEPDHEEEHGELEEEPEEEPEPLPLLDPAGEIGAGAEEAWPEHEEEPAEPVAEPEPVGEPEPKDPGLAESREALDDTFDADDPLAAAKKYGIEPVDLNAMDLSFGPSGTGLEPPEPAENLDVEAVLSRARELVARALTAEALKELRLLSGADAEPEVHRQALGVANEIVRHDANDIGALQARVEFAARTLDDELLIGAYLDLADALARLGSETKARAMYERVLELEPQNEAAREALGAPAEDSDAIDLDAILREMGPVTGGAPPDSSDPAFAAMLSQLRSRAEKGESEDAGDHYDLGLAFKEMGLIDEAIAEFQTALTAGEERLKVYEELGQCFVLKRHFTVALKIFKRALQMPYEDETELLGVYYLLGQCHEELGQRAEAREAYEKVLSIDDTFADVPTRVARL